MKNKKRITIGVILIGALLFCFVGNNYSQTQPSSLNTVQPINKNSEAKDATKNVKPICDGTSITTSCVVDGINYTTYVYHPAVAEKSHTETVTTYQEKVTGYCTLCNDGTYSPSCATGRGACSYHDGVAEWNAPIYSKVPEYSTKTIIDAPAQEAYYEKKAE